MTRFKLDKILIGISAAQILTKAKHTEMILSSRCDESSSCSACLCPLIQFPAAPDRHVATHQIQTDELFQQKAGVIRIRNIGKAVSTKNRPYINKLLD